VNRLVFGRKLLALPSSPVLRPLLEPGDLHPKEVGGQSRLAALYTPPRNAGREGRRLARRNFWGFL